MDFVIFVINFVFSALYLLIVIRAVLPWIPHQRMSPLINPIYQLTEPLLKVVRVGLPPTRMGMDFSPFIVIIFLWLVQKIILRFLI